MIHPLRQRHRRTVIALAIVLPVALAVGIAARKPVPEMDALPKELAPAASVPFESPASPRPDWFAKAPVQVHLLHEHGGAGKFAVRFSCADDFVKPDLMVYWVAGSPKIADTLPDNAVLLGAFSATPLVLSDEMAKAAGRLVLFSLADGEIVDVSRPFTVETN